MMQFTRVHNLLTLTGLLTFTDSLSAAEPQASIA